MTAADLRREVDEELALLAATTRSVAGPAIHRSTVEVALVVPAPSSLEDRAAWRSRCVVTWALLDHLPVDDVPGAAPDPVATAELAEMVDEAIIRLRSIVRARLAATQSILGAGLAGRPEWDESDPGRTAAIDSLVVMLAMTDRQLLVD